MLPGFVFTNLFYTGKDAVQRFEKILCINYSFIFYNNSYEQSALGYFKHC